MPAPTRSAAFFGSRVIASLNVAAASGRLLRLIASHPACSSIATRGLFCASTVPRQAVRPGEIRPGKDAVPGKKCRPRRR